jgi:hypothetical protein
MKYSCDKKQWYLNPYLLGVKVVRRVGAREVSFENSHL